MNNKIKYLPLCLLTAVAIKSLILGLNWESVSSILILSTFYSFLEYKSVSKEVKKMEEQLDEIKKKLKDQELISSDLKNSVSSLRTAAGLKLQSRAF